MSGAGPESIPTSADPRSKRPTKKRALTPTTSQAETLSSLFARPDQPIHTERAAPRRGPLPPDIVTNVQGSSAGAGSGEFHVYKAARRRERERLRLMEEEARAEREQEEFDRERTERQRRDEERTRKNRERREKLKARKGRAKAAAAAPAAANGKQEDLTWDAAAEKGPRAEGEGGARPGVDGDVRPLGTDGAGNDASGEGEAEGLVIHEDN